MLCGSSTPEPNAVSEPTKEPAMLNKTYDKQPNDNLYDIQGQGVFKTDSDSSASVLHTDSSNVESNLFDDNNSIEQMERRKAVEDVLF